MPSGAAVFYCGSRLCVPICNTSEKVGFFRVLASCRHSSRVSSSALVRWTIALLLLGMSSAAAAAPSRAPLYDTVRLNIGINCQWRQKCIVDQQRAMNRALSYVKTQRPSAAKVQLCNRNAARGRYRVDWIGFDNCIRNSALRPVSLRVYKRRFH